MPFPSQLYPASAFPGNIQNLCNGSLMAGPGDMDEDVDGSSALFFDVLEKNVSRTPHGELR
jgi:hypothetical protein